MQARKSINFSPGSLTCAGCQKSIFERYLLGALKNYWHEDCLLCDACKKPVVKAGEKLYYHSGKKLCHRDYARYVAGNFLHFANKRVCLCMVFGRDAGVLVGQGGEQESKDTC